MKLFVIGNGFDCYLHDLPTRYSGFRNYLINNFPKAKEFYFIPESTFMPDGESKYDIDEVVGYIVNVIDCCNGGD